MASQKLEYDASLGGTETLPSHVSSYQYAAGALKEIKSLIDEAQLPASSKLIFQTLPKHMRRRAMSHHPKRLPRKYRAAHKSQMGKAGNQPVIGKRPSRKYRRRPKNLMREYVRRQAKHIWLETHIWHAKRFHMIDRWGYRLPYASCDKTFRACYRASANHCLLQDMSFYICVQLQGSMALLTAGFARLSSDRCGLSIAAKTYALGYREGSIELFADGQYPRGALQRVRFMWRREKAAGTPAARTLWLWLHPAAAEAIIAQLIGVFQLKSTKQQTLPLPPPAEEAGKQQPLRFWTQTKAVERRRTYVNAQNAVELQVLQQELNRYRLTGEQSQRLLTASLRGQRPDEKQSKYCQNALRLNTQQALLSNLIMGFEVVDPRLHRPRKRSNPSVQATPTDFANFLYLQRPDNLPDSCLWDAEARDRLSDNMLTVHKYEQLRQQSAVVPGEPCAFEASLQSVPLLLIQRPGCNEGRLGYGSGWDVVAPADYGMALWKTFIMWGARPGGLREFDSVAREAGVEVHLPDTIAGKQLAGLAAAERRLRYFRLPPNKRCNFRKLAVVSPFTAPWQQLVRDWRISSDASEGGDSNANANGDADGAFYVLRDHRLLHKLKGCVNLALEYPPQVPGDSLIQIRLQLVARGQLRANALICLPTQEDWLQQRRQFQRRDVAPVYLEPALPDANERQRKASRLDHKRQLKRLRARRVREKRKLQETSMRRVHIRAAHTALLVREQFEHMCRLWLPTEPAETLDSVRRQCSREVFGYVSSAGFNYSEARVCGVGYVVAAGLRQLLAERPDSAANINYGGRRSLLCMVRDADSLVYRFARLEISECVFSSPC
ncbi:hypothetical protein KR093_002395 [Drosophila rubida]|uniref:Uncharacterized protein n=1 Tax=Drosophila rubida TaxID=30044 RepID=A0AAD4K9B3_9MUSC|nr:hypothetical protein KR093_002395 [Drosophila rubida]